PGVLPQAARDSAVEAADADGAVGHAEADVRGAEQLADVARRAPAQVHEALEVEADVGQVRAEPLADPRGLEVGAAGRAGGGGGVWVVKTKPARAISRASSRVSWRRWRSSRMRSTARRKPWPSFMWKTVASTPMARRARMPPMPSTISWGRRRAGSGTYRRSV